MRKFYTLISTLFVAFGLACSAQTMTVTGSHIQDAAGNPCEWCSITFSPVDTSGHPLSFRLGSSSGQVLAKSVSAQVVNGAFSIVLPDVSQTNPVNVCFATKVVDQSTGDSVLGAGYRCVQPSSTTGGWCSTTLCNFDEFVPNNAALPVETVGGGGSGSSVNLSAPGPIGNTTPSTGNFTTLTVAADPASSLQVATKQYVDNHAANLASPGPIGATTPDTGTFTNVTAQSITTNAAYNGGFLAGQSGTPAYPPAPPSNSIVFPSVAPGYASEGIIYAFSNAPTTGKTILSCSVPVSTSVTGGTSMVSTCSFVAGGSGGTTSALSFVSYTGGTNGATSSSSFASNENPSSAAPTFSLASGNSLLVSITLGTTATISSVSELGGCTFTQIGSMQSETVGSPDYHYWYLANNCTTAEASDVVSVTTSAAGTYSTVQVYQIASDGAALSLDVQPDAVNTTGTSVSTASFSTTKSNDIVVCDGWVVGTAAQLTAGTGYTLPGTIGGTQWQSTEYRVVGATQSNITGSFSYSSSASLDILCAAVGY